MGPRRGRSRRAHQYVGTDSLPAGLVGPATEVMDLQGRMLLPGFQDGHVHLIGSGVDLSECDLNAATTAAAAADTIRAYAAAHHDLAWIRGAGWQLLLFPEGNPSKEPLDRIVPDRPAMLALYTINAAWAHHQERETGSIEAGKLADLVVLDRNLFEVPVSRIHEVRVVRTLPEGRTVFGQ